MKTLVWFRQDLRLSDNPALAWAAARGTVVPIYILPAQGEALAPGQTWAPGAASRWWLHHSLEALKKSLGGLWIEQGDADEILQLAVRETGADAVAWNRLYEPSSIARDTKLKARLESDGIEVKTFNASLLHEPWDVLTQSGGPYKVFTPFWRACRGRQTPAPIPAPKFQLSLPDAARGDLAQFNLTPKKPNWAAGWEKLWTSGESAAQKRLEKFLDTQLRSYGEHRNRPDRETTSRLSAALHFGEISPRQIWARTQHAMDAGAAPTEDASKFLSEVGWREFSYHLLYHFPGLPEANWKPTFDDYPWRTSAADFDAWSAGRTGYPIVDAGMRELWQTGFMHNRVRMCAASFLTKHLRIDWRAGERWFWDTLVDADLASNSASWQWVTGSGADAAPYFRIFNPVLQGEKFDPHGAYVRRWCPELADMPDAYVHKPFAAPADILKQAGVELGKTYPAPIVDHAAARQAALAGYASLKPVGDAAPVPRKPVART